MPAVTSIDTALEIRGRHVLHLLYHGLTEEPVPYGYALSAEGFRQHLQAVAAVQDNPAYLKPKITFDDGHSSDHDIALPLLQSLGMQAHFFITAGWTDTRPGYMTGEQLRTLHRCGHQIGAHGWSHQLLTHATPTELHRELTRSRETLESILGAEVRTMSLPGGRYNEAVLTACKAAGYIDVFSSVPAAAAPTDRFIGRVNLRSGVTTDTLVQWLNPSTGALHRMGRQYRWKRAGKQLLGDTLYAKLWALLNRAPSAVETEL